MNTIKMVEVTRSNFTESVHHGVAILINSSGEVLKEWGNSNILIYPRSALKTHSITKSLQEWGSRRLEFIR